MYKIKCFGIILNRFAFKAQLGASLIKLMSVFLFYCAATAISNVLSGKRRNLKSGRKRQENCNKM